MSKVVKGIRKIEKAVTPKPLRGLVKGAHKIADKIVGNKYFQYAAMAVAAYFTAGVALSYFPATAGITASMPGFTATASGGAGIFTKAATAMSMSGPASAVAAKSASAAVASGAAAGVPASLASNAIYSAAGSPAIGSVIGASAPAGVSSSSLAALGGPVAGGAGTSAAGGGVGGASVVSQAGGAGGPTAPTSGKGGFFKGFGEMGTADKLLMAKTAVDFASGLATPKPTDIQKEWKKFAKAGGSAEGLITQREAPRPAPQRPSPQQLADLGTPEFLPPTPMAQQTPRIGPRRPYEQEERDEGFLA